MVWDTTWNCQAGRLTIEDPDDEFIDALLDGYGPAWLQPRDPMLDEFPQGTED